METVFGEDSNPRFNAEHKEKIVKFIANLELEKSAYMISLTHKIYICKNFTFF